MQTEISADRLRHDGVMDALDGVTVSLDYGSHIDEVFMGVPEGVVKMWLGTKALESGLSVPVLYGADRNGKITSKTLDEGTTPVDAEFLDWGTLWEARWVKEGTMQVLIWRPSMRATSLNVSTGASGQEQTNQGDSDATASFQ